MAMQVSAPRSETRTGQYINTLAGAALAAYCSRAGIESYIFCPEVSVPLLLYNDLIIFIRIHQL